MPSPTRAQGVAGAAIQGRVLGPDSSAIEDAVVLVTNTTNGERWRTTTRTKGRYGLEQLSIGGPYLVEVRAVGFTPAQRAGFFLALGQRLTVDLTLASAAYELPEIGVEVAADPLINAGRTGPAQSIAESTMARLPVAGRDFAQLALLSPQVTPAPSSTLTIAGKGLSIGGQPDRLNALEIDGASNNDLLGSSLLGSIGTPGQDLGARTLSVEAIKELQVISAPFDVRFGNFAAGLVNAVTKSGSNRFEGAFTSYYSDRGLVGKDPEGARGADFDNKEFGLTLGGPIVRDRLAFFMDAGIQRRTFPETAALIRPDSTGVVDTTVGFSYASAIRFRDILRDTYGVDAGDPGAFPFRIPAENFLGKLTFQLGVNSRLELSHNNSHSDLRIVMDRGFDFYSLTSRVFALPVTTNATRLTWTASFGDRYANELIASRLREAFHCAPASLFPAIYAHAEDRTLAAGSACQSPDAKDQHILELTDNLTFAAGSHRFTLGTHDELIRINSQAFFDYFFSTAWSFSSLDSLEQGHPESYFATLRNPARPSGPLSDFHVNQVGGYAQDQWSPNSRLTLTAGLRLDVPFVSRQPVANPALLSELGIDNTRTPSGHILWSPRLGVSYDVRGDGATFLRGGIGLFAGRPAYKWFVAVEAHTGLEAIHLACLGDDVPAFSIDPANQPTSCGAGDVSSTPQVNVFDPAFRYPRNLKVALGADHRLPWGMVGTVDLLYSRAVDQYDLVDLNLQGPTGVAAGEGNRLMYGTIDSFGVATPSRRSDNFGQVIQVRNARGNHAFSATAQLQKRFPNGTELGASYTYGRSWDRVSASQDAAVDEVNATELDGSLENRRLATAAWEVPHRITLLATANLPFGFRGSLFYEGLSGVPYNYRIVGDDNPAVGDVNADGFFDDDIVYVPRDASPTGDISLVVPDDAGNLLPAPDSVYNRLGRFIESRRCLRGQRGRIMRRNSCRSPWSNNTNARLSKVLPTFGGHSLELSLDVFNVLHLVNKYWGLNRGSEGDLLKLKSYDTVNGRGRYELLDPKRRVVDYDGSRWRMQLGARLTL